VKLATIPHPNNRDGQLIVVSKDNKKAVKVSEPESLKQAVENWDKIKSKLESVSKALNSGSDSFDLDLKKCLAPLPHSPGFFDGSAFLSHVQRARKARGDTMPESAKKTPLMYQGVSDNNLSAYSKIDLMDESFGGDFEGEFAVITSDVPKGTPADKIEPYMILFSLFNDITYREILKTEIQTKFGFLQSKPNSAYAPIVVTPDELGSAWKNGRIELDMECKLNGELFGKPNGREMHFSFSELVAHACRTRPLSAGNIIGTGTVSNEGLEQGFACLTEKRYQEVIDTGKASTPWLKPGDRLWIDVSQNGQSVFGPIDQVAE